MATATLGSAIRQIHRLFDEGTLAGLADGQLLDRFVVDRDDRAFEALVHRHGPMVLGTARAVLKDRHAAEDAFQAAFATLARRAGAIRSGETVGGWLHRVAYREAVKLGVDATRRRTLERQAIPREKPDDDDLRSIVHAELDRLPESFRLPVVLCDLEGLTKGQAAHSLGWTEATVRGRLDRARALLRSRLSRHGLGTSAGVLVASIGREATASVADGQVAAAVRGAMACRVLGLGLGLGWIKVAAGILVLAIGGIALAGSGRLDEPAPIPPKVLAAAVVPENADRETIPVVGRVVDPSGQPVAGALVRLKPYPGTLPQEPGPTATTTADGRFSIRGPRAAFKGRADWGPTVYATSAGLGPAKTAVGHVVEEPGEVTVKLVVDDLPIEGRILDLEGRPVAGATVGVTEIWGPTGVSLAGWLEKVARVGSKGPWQGSNDHQLERVADRIDLTRTTDLDGRFRLTGVGRERLATLSISGPTIATSHVFAMTRPGPAVTTPDRGPGEASLVYHASGFDHVATPNRPVEGVVTDAETGAPLAGIVIQADVIEPYGPYEPSSLATTDARGAYRLAGLRMGASYQFLAIPPSGAPYLQSSHEVPADRSSGRTDLTLKRGVLVRGRIIDRTTGKPVVRAFLQTFAFVDNPNVRKFPGYRGSSSLSDADGRFAVVALPGRGLLTARSDFSIYLRGKGVETIAGFDPSRGWFFTAPFFCHGTDHHATVAIDPPDGTSSIDQDLQVERGQTLSGTVLDPEGRPIGGLISSDLDPSGWRGQMPHESSTFEARGVDPARPRRVYFFHEGRKLAGSVVLPPKEPGPIVVKLQPWGSVTGRIVDDDGQPRPGYVLLPNMPFQPQFDEARGFVPINEPIEVGPDARYRVDRLVSGLSYTVHASKGINAFGAVFKDVRIQPGEVKDVGDSKIRPFGE